MKDHPYACPECQGTCEVECDCCGSTISCDECDGSGLDAEKIDVPAFLKAEKELGYSTSSLRNEKKEIIGRKNQDGKKVLYKDFASKFGKEETLLTYNQGFAAAGRALLDDPSPENPYTEGTAAHQGFEAYLVTVLAKRT